jgi:glycosyltransferase involved in cell wall biosynthesis
VKIKVIEAMASSLAVVATSVGAQGLQVVSGEHLVIADEPDRFAAEVLQLLGDPARAEKIGRAGHDYIVAIGSPQVVEPRLAAILDAVVDGRRRKIPSLDWCLNRVRRAGRRARWSFDQFRETFFQTKCLDQHPA